MRTSHVLNEAIAALAAALSGCGMAISLAALVFTGPLEGGLPRAISSFVLAGAIVAGFVGWRSQLVPAASIVQDGPAVVMVAVAAGVAARGGDGATVDVFVMLALTTLATGTAMWLFGRFGLGNLARYIPATVVSAFIAGTGYLLTKGGLDVMVGFGIGLDTIGDLLEPTLLKLWLPGAALGVAIWLVQRSPRLPPVAMSVSILASLAVFYTVVAAFSSIDAVEQGGWLIGPFSDSTGIHPVTPGEVSDANWGHIVGESAGIFSVIGVAVIALLLNLSGLELVGGERIDVDRELKSTGIANLLMAPFGAPPGFHALGDTVLVRRMGATRRAVPVLVPVEEHNGKQCLIRERPKRF